MKINTRLINVTPFYMFVRQAQDSLDNIRASSDGVDFTPVQFGGIFGQKTSLQEEAVMEVTEFDGGDRRNTVQIGKVGR
ncbi:MAG TPA: hypothetical protein VFM18_07095 [Methanosarcina sp.]|nr:hypothetical protein [Methanosarcina sp.]